MDKAKFRIRGLGPGLDGLYVDVDDMGSECDACMDIVCVTKLTNMSIMNGDRNVSVQLPPCGLYIDKKFLEATQEVGIREFSSESGFGNFIDHRSVAKGSLIIDTVRYQETISVNVSRVAGEEIRTVTSFYINKKLEACWTEIIKLLGKNEIDDVVFELDSLREWSEDDHVSNDGE